MKYLLVSDPVNVAYLSGYRAGSMRERETLLLAEFADKGGFRQQPKRVWLIVPELFWLAAKGSKRLRVGTAVKLVKLRSGSKFTAELAKLLGKLDVRELFFEADDLTYAEVMRMRTALKPKTRFVPRSGTVEGLRVIKSDWEIDNIAEAVRIAERAFTSWRSWLKAGVSELEAGQQLQKFLLAAGAEGPAFPAIVAFGASSANPHHLPGRRKLADDQAVLVDWGAVYRGYHSDQTRCFWYGQNPSKLFRQRLMLVQQAYQAAVEVFTTGGSVAAATAAASEQLGEHKRKFIHSLGHGLGLEIHEQPHLHEKNKRKLAPGTVFTVEPGIYFEGWGGIRLENTAMIAASGKLEILNALPLTA